VSRPAIEASTAPGCRANGKPHEPLELIGRGPRFVCTKSSTWRSREPSGVRSRGASVAQSVALGCRHDRLSSVIGRSRGLTLLLRPQARQRRRALRIRTCTSSRDRLPDPPRTRDMARERPRWIASAREPLHNADVGLSSRADSRFLACTWIAPGATASATENQADTPVLIRVEHTAARTEMSLNSDRMMERPPGRRYPPRSPRSPPATATPTRAEPPVW
jgi:hypothetical protein